MQWSKVSQLQQVRSNQVQAFIGNVKVRPSYSQHWRKWTHLPTEVNRLYFGFFVFVSEAMERQWKDTMSSQRELLAYTLFAWEVIRTWGFVISYDVKVLQIGLSSVRQTFLLVRKTRITGQPISLGEGVAAHLGHQLCRLPLRDVASHVRVKQLLNWTLYPFE